MKRFFHLMALATVAAVLVAGCQKYDDSELRKEIQELREKLSSLEAWCSNSQSAIDAVAILQEVVNNMNSVESIDPFIDADGTTGFVITFTDKRTIKLYNGQNGKDGDAFFGSVVINDDCIVFTLADGRTFTVPRKQDEHNYLAFEAVEAGATVTLEIIGEVEATSLKYSTNKLDWVDFDFSNPVTITLENVGDKVYWRNADVTDQFSKDGENYYHFDLGEKKIAASGNIMSLIDKSCQSLTIPADYCFMGLFDMDSTLVSAPELPATELTRYCYCSLFYGCTSLETAPELPAKNVVDACYYAMFFGCTSLKKAPALPATTMESYCYYAMFIGCRSLEEAPALPAETLANDCYYEMFHGCTSLKKAPELPAEKTVSECYVYMFSNCTSLEEAPALPAKILDRFCYYGMFDGCSNLKTAPALPAEELGEYCYGCMFDGCSSLVSAPELPAKVLVEGCYNLMFEGCASLETAPELPFAELTPYCYYGMFVDCSSLKEAPELPSTELAPYCYTYMFLGCSSLTAAPELPATELADYCYAAMFGDCKSLEVAPELPAEHLALACYESLFEGCEKINHVKVGFTDWGDGYMTRYWLDDTAPEGAFEGPEILEAKYGSNYIPEGWTFNGRAPEAL